MPQQRKRNGEPTVRQDMYKLFAMLEMKYDFKLSKNGEMEETR